MKVLKATLLVLFCISICKLQGQDDPVGPTTVDPTFNFSLEFNEISQCNYNGSLIIELTNSEDSYYNLPYEVDLMDLSDQSESYYEMDSETLTISGLESGTYMAEIRYTDGCYQQFELDLDYSETGVFANLNGGSLCDEDDVKLSLTDIALYSDNESTNYSIEWTKDGSNIDMSTESIQVSEGGEYCAKITDIDTNCDDTFCYTVVNFSSIYDIITKSVDCDNGLTDGSINLEFSESADSYDIEVSWTGPNGFNSTDSKLSNLENGVYKLSITYTDKETGVVNCVVQEEVILYCTGEEPPVQCPFIVILSSHGSPNVAGSISSNTAINTILTFTVYNDIGNSVSSHSQQINIDPNSLIDPSTIQYFGWDTGLQDFPGSYTVEIEYLGSVCQTTTLLIVGNFVDPCSNSLICNITEELAILFCLPSCEPVTTISDGTSAGTVDNDCSCTVDLVSDPCDEYYINDDEEIQSNDQLLRIFKFSSMHNVIKSYIFTGNTENFELELTIDNPRNVKPISVFKQNDNFLLTYLINSQYEFVLVDTSGVIINDEIFNYVILDIKKFNNSIYVTYTDDMGIIYSSLLSASLELKDSIEWSNSLKSNDFSFAIDKDFAIYSTSSNESNLYSIFNITSESFTFSLSNNVEVIFGQKYTTYFTIGIKSYLSFTFNGITYGDSNTTSYYLMSFDLQGDLVSVSSIPTSSISDVYGVSAYYNIVYGSVDSGNCIDIEPMGADNSINASSRQSSLSIDSIFIKPNPFDNYLEIGIEGIITEPLKCRIVNSLGQTVRFIEIVSNSTIIETDEYRQGVYFLELEPSGSSNIFKLVKY